MIRMSLTRTSPVMATGESTWSQHTMHVGNVSNKTVSQEPFNTDRSFSHTLEKQNFLVRVP